MPGDQCQPLVPRPTGNQPTANRWHPHCAEYREKREPPKDFVVVVEHEDRGIQSAALAGRICKEFFHVCSDVDPSFGQITGRLHRLSPSSQHYNRIGW
jgi:hypothetical protein